MTWTTISRVDAGDDVTSSAWNNQVKGNLEHLYSVPRCEAYRSADQTIGNASFTSVTWDSETFDTASIHDTSTNSDRFTLVRDGMWLVVAQINFVSNATGTRRARLRFNDSSTLSQSYFYTASGDTARFTTSAIVYTDTTTDYVSLQVFQNSGGNLNFNGGSAAASRMSVAWLGS